MNREEIVRARDVISDWSVKNAIVPDRDFPYFELAISALEKQISQKPEPTTDKYIKFVCPVCGAELLRNFDCYNCHQVIDWKAGEQE